MRKSLIVFAAFLTSAQTAPVPDEIAYVTISRKGDQLKIGNDDGTNVTTLLKASSHMRFDLGPRGSGRIAVSDSEGIKLLTYVRTQAGGYTDIGVELIYSGQRHARNIDLSPDGTKVAFPGANEELLVYDTATGQTTEWAKPSFVWDVAWHSDGNGLVFIEPGMSNVNAKLWEVASPGAAPILLFESTTIDAVDAARTERALVVTYYDGTTLGDVIGLWKNGAMADPRIDDSTSIADWGTMNCDDSRLLYAAPNKARQSVWYVLDLDTGQRTLFSKATGLRWTQFFPTC